MKDMEGTFPLFKWDWFHLLWWMSFITLALYHLLFVSACSADVVIEDTEKKIDSSYLLNRCISLIDKDVIALDASMLFISRDLGKTWKKGPAIEKGQFVRLAYLFEDGTLFYCTDEGCYFSNDYQIVQKSKVYDIDGSIFSPDSPFHCFSAYEHDGFRQIIDGIEILCWGNYNNEAKNIGFIPRIWLTSDKGKTVRCSYRFGDDNLKARHVHAVNFNRSDSSFWAQTGDFAGECHWLKGIYDKKNGIIDWSLVRSGIRTGNMQFYGDWIYASKDSRPGGVFRVKYSDASNATKGELVFQTPNECLSVYMGMRGDIVAIMTTEGGDYDPRNVYYSQDLEAFYEIAIQVPDSLQSFGYSIFYNSWGVTNNGDLVSGIRTRAKTGLSEWDFSPSIWISDLIRDSGFPMALSTKDK